MDSDTVAPQLSASQDTQAQTTNSALDLLASDLHKIRDRLVRAEKRRCSGVLAGQLLILVNEYRAGRRPNGRTLKRFFYFVGREVA